jgi:hypothetical protein
MLNPRPVAQRVPPVSFHFQPVNPCADPAPREHKDFNVIVQVRAGRRRPVPLYHHQPDMKEIRHPVSNILQKMRNPVDCIPINTMFN